MRRLDALAGAAGRHLPLAALLAFLLLLANMYLLRVRVLSDLVAGGVVLVAVLVAVAAVSVSVSAIVSMSMSSGVMRWRAEVATGSLLRL